MVAAAQTPDIPEVPRDFKIDVQTAARLRPQLLAESIAPTGRYSTGELVFQRLLRFVPSNPTLFKWQLRVVANDQLNAYASPDGSIMLKVVSRILRDRARVYGRQSFRTKSRMSYDVTGLVVTFISRAFNNRGQRLSSSEIPDNQEHGRTLARLQPTWDNFFES